MYSSPSVVTSGPSRFSEVLIAMRNTDAAARAGVAVVVANAGRAIEDAIKVLRVTCIALSFEVGAAFVGARILGGLGRPLAASGCFALAAANQVRPGDTTQEPGQRGFDAPTMERCCYPRFLRFSRRVRLAYSL